MNERCLYREWRTQIINFFLYLRASCLRGDLAAKRFASRNSRLNKKRPGSFAKNLACVSPLFFTLCLPLLLRIAGRR